MAKGSTKSLKETIQALKKGVSPAPAKPKAETDKLKKTPYGGNPDPKAKSGRNYIPKGLGNGGARDGAGREPGGTQSQRRLRKQMIDQHFGEMVEIEVQDPKSGKKHRIKKSRTLVQLERLYLAGYNGGKLNADAIDKWLNRALGKAPQPLIGDEEEDPIQVDHGMERILGKAYGDDSEKE